MKTLIIEGWRFIAHSYSTVSLFHCRELLKHPDLMIFHRDAPFNNPQWKAVDGLFDTADEAALKAIPRATDDRKADAVFRISFPYRLDPSPSGPTFVFGTSEFGYVYDEMVEGKRPLREALAGNGVRIITPSEWSRQGFVRSGAPTERVSVVPHGVDLQLFRPVSPDERAAQRRKVGWDADAFIFLNIGTMTSNKGVEPMLKAFARVARRHPDVRLALKGVDALYASRQFLDEAMRPLEPAEKEAVTKRILYLGNNLSFADLAGLYQAADAYLSPYLAEGFNLPVLEAMACGLPVICTKGGSTEDFIAEEAVLRIDSRFEKCPGVDGKTRCLVVPNSEHLVALMEKAVEDRAWMERARQAGPPWVAARFTWKAVTDQLCGVLFG
jgi:glycosyltransferase involved in cell wall biosynthesis